jgi:hypothetical protein
MGNFLGEILALKNNTGFQEESLDSWEIPRF